MPPWTSLAEYPAPPVPAKEGCGHTNRKPWLDACSHHARDCPNAQEISKARNDPDGAPEDEEEPADATEPDPVPSVLWRNTWLVENG